MKLPPDLALLRRALFDTASLLELAPAEWDLLIRQASRSQLLARIAVRCQQARILAQIPAGPGMHLRSALQLFEQQQREIFWEAKEIAQALHTLNVPIVLLKGAAYALADCDAAWGRRLSDVDILVPAEALADVESQLMKQGWMTSKQSAYDQHYYRRWMHELPPLRHIHRGTVIDVHHALLPRSARLQPDSRRLLACARPLARQPELQILAPIDMLLHSACHLFHEGELERGFRDLVDIDSLLREFGSPTASSSAHTHSTDFWNQLVPRAVELDLSRPLFYALRYAHLLLGSAIPAAVLQQAALAPGGRRSGLGLRWMDALFSRALRPDHATTRDRWTSAARWLLYVRSHWLRMPPWLLLPHLLRKAFMRPQNLLSG